MKKMAVWLLVLALMLPAAALAGGSVLLTELPQDAVMVENVEFDDGDFIQTYQLAGGASVQLLRYASFDMTLGDLIASEWLGCTDVRQLGPDTVGGYPAQGLRFLFAEEGQEPLDVALVVIDADESLVFVAAFPQSLGETQIDAMLQPMLDSMDVATGGRPAADETAEVG